MNLKTKLIYTIVLLIIIPLLLCGFLFNHQINGIVLQDKITSISQQLDQNIHHADDILSHLKELTLLTSLYPPIQGIIRSRETGVDPLDGSSLTEWKKRLASIFSSQLTHSNSIYQIRYIDKAGKEIVRVQKEQSGNIVVVPEPELQDKSQSDYFKNAQSLLSGDVYVSPVNLNREHGFIQEPHIPTMRFVVKVMSATDKTFQGAVVLNHNPEYMFSQFKTAMFGDMFFLNDEGYYISHQDQSKTFGFELEHEKNYFEENPQLKEALTVNNLQPYYDKKKNLHRIIKKFYYNKKSSDRYWVLVYEFDQDMFQELFQSWYQFFIVLMVLFLVLVGILAWYLADFIVKPILEMSRAVPKVDKKLMRFEIAQQLKDRQDEIGFLAQSMEKMGADALKSKTYLDRLVQEKTKELENKMDELTLINEAMVGREQRMMELKQEVNFLLKELGRPARYKELYNEDD